MGTRATWRHVLPGMAWALHCPCVSADHRATGAPRGWAMSEFAAGRRVRQPAIPGCLSSRGLRARAAAWLTRRAPPNLPAASWARSASLEDDCGSRWHSAVNVQKHATAHWRAGRKLKRPDDDYSVFLLFRVGSWRMVVCKGAVPVVGARWRRPQCGGHTPWRYHPCPSDP